MAFLDRIPFLYLSLAALFMLGAPFLPEPHLIEKMRMLAAGTLTRPLDIFDVVWHLLPTMLLLIKTLRWRRQRGNPAPGA
jgi:hypothetical protein